MAATLGSFVDWYDFMLAGSVSALVWTNLYFGYLSGAAAAGLAIATYGVTFATRPIGAYVFGHLGDKRGRRDMLIWTLLTSGLAMVGMTVTPGYYMIGIAAPILMMLYRIVFGFGMGGEYGGAQTWITEMAGPKWRGFWNALVYSGQPLGALTAALAVTATILVMGPAFYTSGWRIPFAAGTLVLVIALLIRYTLPESPAFLEFKRKRIVVKSPATEVLRKYWRKVLIFSFYFAPGVAAGVLLVSGAYPVAFMNALKIPPASITFAVSLGYVPAIFCNLFSGVLSDIIGRKWVMFIGQLIPTFIVAIFFQTMLTGMLPLIWAVELAFSAARYLNSGVTSVVFVEQFPARYRYSGSGLSYQFSALIGGLIGSFAVSPLVAFGGGVLAAWPYVAGLMIALQIIACASVFLMKESARSQLEE